MVSIKSDREIELMRHAGHINYLCHKYLEKQLKPGITTKEIDELAGKFMKEHDCVSSSLGYEDISMSYKGYHSDSAATYAVGQIDKETKMLIDETKNALMKGLAQIKEGARLGDISNAIEEHAHSFNLGVVEELCGHGIGTKLHEDPDIPNFGEKGTGITLKSGMTFAIEPMLNLGTKEVYLLDDDWTVITADGKPSAHFEHTVLVTKDGYEILTGE